VVLSLSMGLDVLAAATGTIGTYSGIVSGPNALVVGDGVNKGTVVLTGTNSYVGGTVILGGATLGVGGDANLGNINGGVTLQGGELLTTSNGFSTRRAIELAGGPMVNVVAAANGTAATYTGVFSDDGALVVGDGTHGGTVILTGDNTYNGGTVVEGGTLLVDNAAALGTGDVTVSGGTLGSLVRPLNILGNYTQTAGGTLQLSVEGASPGQYDSLAVVGNAALGGTLQLISGFKPAAGNQLTLVTTGGVVSGRFARFESPFVVGPSFNTIDLVYGRDSVILEFLNTVTPISPVVPRVPTIPTGPGTSPIIISTVDFVPFALTVNQTASASLANQVELDGRAAGMIGFLLNDPFNNLPGDLNKISPDGLTAFDDIGFSNANIQKLTLENRFDDIHNGANGFSSNMNINEAKTNPEGKEVVDGKSSKEVEPVLQHAPENRWGVWVTGFGDFVNVDGDGNAQGYNFTTGGVSLGIDFRLTDQLTIGAMGDYSHTWTSLNPSGHIDVDSGRGGVYATWYHHGFYVNAAIYGGHDNYDSSRAGLGGLASGSTEGSEWSTFVSGGYDFHFGPLTVGPIASLQYTDVHVDGFSEKGSLAPLAIHSDSAESLRSDAGFRAFYAWQIGKIVVEPSLKVAWEHEYKYSALPITAGFAGIPGPSATFFGPDEGHDSAVISAGVSVQLTPAISTYLNYDGQLGRSNYDSNAVTGGVRISF
jgi:outer membrane autotransporter protein